VTDSPRVSIIVPCYNGSDFVATTLSRLFAFLRNCSDLGSFEVIFVDDGSTDESIAVVRSAFPEIRNIRHAENRGKGAAVRSGMLAARGRFLFFIDCDIPYDLDALPRMLDYLDRKEFDVCIGSRTSLPGNRSHRRRWIRRLASRFFTELVSRIVVTGVRDTQCGFKGFRRTAARYLFSQSRIDNFAFDVEVLYLAYKNDLDVRRVPVHLVSDDVSSVSLIRHGLPMLLELPKLPWRWYTGRYSRILDEKIEISA
jgi:dolichyl-phosphate beta-glucosyltransferase